MRYRKKPVVIEAYQLPAAGESVPDSFHDWAQRFSFKYSSGRNETLEIDTLEGVMAAQPGDWIIRGVKGEFYPCKPDIFSATYEVAADSPALLQVGQTDRSVFEKAAGKDGEYDSRFTTNFGTDAYFRPDINAMWEGWQLAVESGARIGSTQQGGEHTITEDHPRFHQCLQRFEDEYKNEEGVPRGSENFFLAWDYFKAGFSAAVLPQVGEARPDMRSVTNDRKAVASAERAIRENPALTLAIVRRLQEQLDEARLATPASLGAAKPTLPEGLIERLRINAGNKDNTAFARSTMREVLESVVVGEAKTVVLDWDTIEDSMPEDGIFTSDDGFIKCSAQFLHSFANNIHALTAISAAQALLLAEKESIIKDMQQFVDDPMWSDRIELSKSTLLKWIASLQGEKV